MKVYVVTVAYNSGFGLYRLIDTAMADSTKHEIVCCVITHSDHPETIEVAYMATRDFGIELHDIRKNRGIARSWNDGMIQGFEWGADTVIICNDDIAFSPGDIDKMARKAKANPKNYIISCAGYHEGLNEMRKTHGYSCFALNPISMEMVGCFDENFWPAYLEDLDHHRRATLLGLVEENCADTMVWHQGSATIANDPILSLDNMVTQNKNIRYMQDKWSSQTHEGGYRYPFNSKFYSLRIAPEDRHHPYGPWDRKDIPRD